MMRTYCKAHHLKDLRHIPRRNQHGHEDEAAIADETIVYLRDEFMEVTTPLSAATDILSDEVIPEWQEFCQTTLRFEIPEDLRSVYQESRPQERILKKRLRYQTTTSSEIKEGGKLENDH